MAQQHAAHLHRGLGGQSEGEPGFWLNHIGASFNRITALHAALGTIAVPTGENVRAIQLSAPLYVTGIEYRGLQIRVRHTVLSSRRTKRLQHR